MANKIQWSNEWWREWQNKPTQETAEKYGLPWNEVSGKWGSWDKQKWQSMSPDQGKEEIKASKWSTWFWWE